MSYCSKCGTQVKDDDCFCAKCGAPVNLNSTSVNVQRINMGSYKSKLINPDLPIVLKYIDKYDKATIEDVIQAANNGDVVAKNELAIRYHMGDGGVNRDPDKAISLSKEVLKVQNNTDAYYIIGYWYADENCSKEEQNEGIQCYEAACELGDSGAAHQLGLLYEFGNVVPKDLEKAIECYRIEANPESKSCGEGLCKIGEMYFKLNKGLEALDYYKKALKYDYAAADAYLGLGMLYEYGADGIEVDLGNARSYYLNAYNHRDKDRPGDTIFFWAKFLFNQSDEAEPHNHKRAFDLFVEDYEHGNNRACLYLGYYYGLGIQGELNPDCEKAFGYLSNVQDYQKAEALYYQGLIYHMTLHDDVKAKQFLSMAANQGNKSAQEMINKINTSFCRKCGQPISPTSKFCGKCGTPVESFSNSPVDSPDPQQLVDQAGQKLDAGNLREAKEIIIKAYRLYPNNDKVIYCCGLITSIDLSCLWGVGAEGSANAKDACNLLFELSDKLKRNNNMLEKASQFESTAHCGMGRYYNDNGNFDMALRELKQTDVLLNPFAAYVIYDIHINLVQRKENEPLESYNNRRRIIEKEFVSDMELLKKALNSNHFANKRDKCLIYLAIYSQYSMGSLYVPKNVNYAYDCVKKAYDLCPDIAEEELTHFETDSRGNLVYIP